MKQTKRVVIYTDGACSGNPGPGGWGAILFYKDNKKEISGFADMTTNNEMELTAAIKALELLKEPCAVKLYSDSAYLINAFKENWVCNWKKNNFVNANKKPIANKELWLKIIKLDEEHRITWYKVKGHSDNKFNNRCDELATGEIVKNKKQEV